MLARYWRSAPSEAKSAEDGAAPRVPARMRGAADPYLWPWSGRPQATSNDPTTVSLRPKYITAEGRDLRIDLLRGFFVLAMIVDHVAGASPLYLFTGGNRFFVSAAEGFILVSGLLAGLIYRRVVARDGLLTAARKAWARAITLYLVTIGITLVLLPLSEWAGLSWAEGLDFTHSLNLVVSILTLHRTYYLADVLLLYTVLFALMPMALLLMADGKTRLLLGLSGLLWGLHQLFPDEAAALWPIAGNYLFRFSAWQLLFVAGLVLGYCRDHLPALTQRQARYLQLGTGIACLGLIVFYALLETSTLAKLGPSWQTAQSWIQLFVFNKADLGPGRLVAAAIVFAFLFLTLTRHWNGVRWWLYWLLAPLGQNSLYAFTAHVIVVTAVALALTPLGLAKESPWWLNAAIQAGSVALIWHLTRRHLLEPSPKTQAAWRISPVAVAILAIVIWPWLPIQSANQAAAAPPVSDAILARARAYGTPVTHLSLATPIAPVILHATPAADPAAIVAPAAGRPTAEPTLPPAPPAARQTPGASVRTAATSTPVPPIRRVEPPTNTPNPAALDVPSRAAQPTPNPTSSASLTTRLSATLASVAAAIQSTARFPQPQAATSADPARPVAAAPVEPLPPLPPDSERLRTDYIGPLTGSTYAGTLHSEILNRDMPYWIYLPPGYGQTSRRYPVLYMLHGGGGVLDEWAALGLFEAADRAINAGAMQPVIIVLPQGDKSYWANWSNDSPRWGDYVAYEVVGHIDAAFGAIRDRSARAIGGLSMGAWGALYQAFTHPDIFGVVGAHSPSLYPDDNNLKFLGVGAEFASKDPASLARMIPRLDTLHIWMDVSENDPWLDATTGLHNVLAQRGVLHEWHVNPGYHASVYWAQHIPEYLAFYGHALAGQPARQSAKS